MDELKARIIELEGCGPNGEIDEPINSEYHQRVKNSCDEMKLVHRFYRVPGDYYDRSLQERANLLHAPSVHHLCKSILVKNCMWDSTAKFGSENLNSEYYIVIVQYTTSLDTALLGQLVYLLPEKSERIPKKNYNFRFATQEESDELSGFIHNAISPVGMKKSVPIIVAKSILELNPPWIYMGGGEVDLKLQVNIEQFIKATNALVFNVTLPRDPSEYSKLDITSSSSSTTTTTTTTTTIDPAILEEFDRLEMRVGKIVDAKLHPESDKLLIEMIDVGEKNEDGTAKPRQILSGIQHFYKPEEIIGKSCAVLCNLKPAKLGGILSCGMVMCAKNETDLALVEVSPEIEAGTRIALSLVVEPKDPVSASMMKRKKIFESMVANLTMNEQKQPCYKDVEWKIIGQSEDEKFIIDPRVQTPAMVA